MKYTNQMNLFRIHEFKDHNILVIRKRGIMARFYLKSPFNMQRVLDRWQHTPTYKEMDYTTHTDYNDWVPYEDKPSYVPDHQWFNYYLKMWEKRKYEV